MSIEASLRDLAGRWAAVPAGESANFPLYIRDLTDALGVGPPQPRGSGYEFEYPVKVMSRGGTQLSPLPGAVSGHPKLRRAERSGGDRDDRGPGSCTGGNRPADAERGG